MRGATGLRAMVVAMAWSSLALGGGSAAAAGPGVSTMSAGDFHTCAVRTNGTVWCWGDASSGQAGDGTTGDADGLRKSPVQVRRGSSPLRGVTEVAAGVSHTCAVRGDGTVWCWGDMSFGQLGNDRVGPGEHRTRAVRVQRVNGELTGVSHIATGGDHTCALRTNGSVYCWGQAEYGQLGNGTTGPGGTGTVWSAAVRVRQGSGSLENVVAIAVGYQHSCAVKRGGSVWCWGDGQFGQLGDGQSGAGHHRTKAVRVKRGGGFLTNASGIAAGGFQTCVRRADRSAWCWGFAENGQLGDGTTGDAITHIRTKAVQVRRGSGALTRVTSIGAGSYHSCARRSDGSAWCWGDGRYGQLGDGTTGDAATHLRLTAVRVRRSASPFTDVRRLEGGVSHTCAVRADHTMWCWGADSHGQLGRGSRDDDAHPFPRRVLFP